jgi:hypothetical protein
VSGAISLLTEVIEKKRARFLYPEFSIGDVKF